MREEEEMREEEKSTIAANQIARLAELELQMLRKPK
jgi:hypothetical protein